MTSKALAGYIARFRGKRVAVVGDYMLDEFVWGRASRISPEAPVPVVEVTHETAAPGGAGNVAANIVAMGGRAPAFGIIGQDAAGRKLRALLRARGGEVAGLLAASGRLTPLKTRIIETARKHQVARADRESRGSAPAALLRRLATSLLALHPLHAVIISDYDKGTVTPELLNRILPELERRRVPVFVDPRTRHPQSYRPITIITPNEREAERIAGVEISDDASLADAGRRILQMLGCAYVLITRGERGMALFDRGGGMLSVPTTAREVYDVTGAGDTVIAVLALAHAAGAPMPAAAALANYAAGIVVGHVGTAAPTADELAAAIRG